MKTDKEKQELKGLVKTVHVESSQYRVQEDGQTIEMPGYNPTTIFNRDGWIIEQFHKNPDGSKWRIVSDYSEKGMLITTRSYHNSDVPIGEVKYIYDDKGRLTAEQYKEQNGKIMTPTTYFYNSEGRKTKIQELDFTEDEMVVIGIEGTNGGIFVGGAKRVETLYDYQDGVVEVKIFNSDGALLSRAELIRDADGSLVEETQYLGDIVEFSPFASGSEAAKEMAALTEQQRTEAEREAARIFSPGSVISKRIHKYNESGMLTETKQTMMGMETERQTFAYDEYGNKSEEVNYHGDGFESKTIFTRDFDANGNWTREEVSTTSSSNAETEITNAVSVTRRTFTYY